MSIGNNNDDNFDDMTFDDMTFDDMPLDNDIEMNPNNNVGMDTGMGQQNNGMGMNLGQQSMNLGQQNMNLNMGMNQQGMSVGQQNMSMNMNQQMPNNKKAKKAKKEKVHKQPKQKTPKTKKDKHNKNKVVHMNEVVANEDNENSSKGKIVFIVLGVLAVAVIIAIALFMNRTKNANKHIIIADNTQRVENTEVSKTVDGIVVGDNSTESTESTESTDVGVIKLKKPMKIALTVNTKTAGETEYSDHETYIEVEYTDFVAGYDKVKKYLDEYNENSTNKINLPDKEEFYSSSKGNDLVMYEVKVTVPKDFPTNDEKHGYTGLKPKFTLGIKGTEKENALITKLYEFAIPTVYNIGDDTTQDFTIGQTYTLRYMVTMPTELSKDGYKLTLNYSNEDTNNNYTLESVDIPSNDEAKTK